MPAASNKGLKRHIKIFGDITSKRSYFYLFRIIVGNTFDYLSCVNMFSTWPSKNPQFTASKTKISNCVCKFPGKLTWNDSQCRIQYLPKVGAPTPKWVLLCKFVAENCMKMKEFGPSGGGGASSLGSTNDSDEYFRIILISGFPENCSVIKQSEEDAESGLYWITFPGLWFKYINIDNRSIVFRSQKISSKLYY